MSQPDQIAAAYRAAKLASGEWVERLLACGHIVTYDIQKENPKPGDLRFCFEHHRHYEVIARVSA